MKTISILTLVLGFFLSITTFATEYEIDGAHSNVGFKIKHMGFSTVVGRFDKVKGTFAWDAKKKMEKPELNVIIDAASINTNEAKRDTHLRGPDFFDVTKHPTLTFNGTKILKMTGNNFDLEGDLTIHGVTKKAVLKVTFNGEGTDPMGTKKASFSASTNINRKDFGITSGAVMIGDKVDIMIEIEAGAKGPTALKS